MTGPWDIGPVDALVSECCRHPACEHPRDAFWVVLFLLSEEAKPDPTFDLVDEIEAHAVIEWGPLAGEVLRVLRLDHGEAIAKCAGLLWATFDALTEKPNWREPVVRNLRPTMSEAGWRQIGSRLNWDVALAFRMDSR